MQNDRQTQEKVLAQRFVSILDAMCDLRLDEFRKLKNALAQGMAARPVSNEEASKIIWENQEVWDSLHTSPNAQRFHKAAEGIYDAMAAIKKSLLAQARSRDALGRFVK